MQILILGSRVPYPLHDGGNLAVYNMIEGLQAHGNIELSLLCMNTNRHWVDTNTLPAIFQQFKNFETIAIDNRIKPIPALLSFINGSSYNLERFISKHFEQALTKLLQNNHYDLVLLEGLFVTPYIDIIRKLSNAKICYRQHNVEYQIWERLAQNTSNFFKKIYLNQLAKALKTYELQHLNDYDLIAAISPIDADLYKQLGCQKPIIDIPYCIKSEPLSNNQPELRSPLKMYHIGAMDWQPNIEAIDWFLEHVWPGIILKEPLAKLYLAGRKMPEKYATGLWKNVFVLGEVPDAKVFEMDKHILIVPLLSGGGLRIKILEAMAAGKTVVSTKIGLQGIYQANDNKEVIIADQPEIFAEQCVQLLQNPEKAEEIGKNAQKLIQSTYNQKSVIDNFIVHINSILKTN